MSYVNTTIPLYVSAASIEAYKAADYWKEFTNIQAADMPDGVENITSNAVCNTHKVLEDGAIYIFYGNERYTIDGRKVR